MRHIKDCTLVCVDCYNYGSALTAIKKTLEQCSFERVVFFTDRMIREEGIETVIIPTIKSKNEYSRFMMKDLHSFINTGYILVIQHDGYVLNGDCFDEKLYSFDYCGAMWLETDGLNCGNGGFSWRSKRLLDAVANDSNINSYEPEDVQICRVYRNYLEKKYWLKWATEDVAEKFSFELREPNQRTFGFHGYFHRPFCETIILKRSGAMGDIVLMEPIIRHYLSNGYKVVLDIPERYFDLFSDNMFHVKHISRFDSVRIPAKRINLDMSYESMPNVNIQEAYFRTCGITDYTLSRPKLGPLVGSDTKLFKKYAIIHLEYRDSESRNIFGVDWGKVEERLKELGYMVLQVGSGNVYKCGDVINNSSVGFLKFLVGGCDLFIGIDSGVSHIAVAYNKPSIILFGSTDPNIVHADIRGIVEVIQGECDNKGCWHGSVGTTNGITCKYLGTDKYLQCGILSSDKIVKTINKIHGIE